MEATFSRMLPIFSPCRPIWMKSFSISGTFSATTSRTRSTMRRVVSRLEPMGVSALMMMIPSSDSGKRTKPMAGIMMRLPARIKRIAKMTKPRGARDQFRMLL